MRQIQDMALELFEGRGFEATTANDMHRGKSGGKMSNKARTEVELQLARDKNPGKFSLATCKIAVGILFSHFDGVYVGDESWTFGG